MTDTEQKAHDIAVAFAACVEQAKQASVLNANIDLDNLQRPIDANPDAFVKVYKLAYDKALSALEQ